MEDFFRSIERQAYRMALFACHNHDDALDLVQDSMCQFVSKYSRKPQADWKALFYKILQNKIRDYYRKESVRSRWRVWFSKPTDGETSDPLEIQRDIKEIDPEQMTQHKQAFYQLQQELKQLSLKQQQVFILRAWEGLSIGETALAMRCSEGTVKTHYFRATDRLKAKLGEHWP